MKPRLRRRIPDLWHRRGLEREGFEPFEGELPFQDTESSMGRINVSMKSVSQNLRRGFLEFGITRPVLTGNTDIYEQAFLGLAGILLKARMPEVLRNSALGELAILSDALAELFAGEIKTRDIETDSLGVSFEGYQESSYDQTRRVIVFTKPHPSYSDKLGKYTEPNTQILLKEVKGINSRGRAIAAHADGFWRVGLRYGGQDYKKWAVSIDAGVKTHSGDWKRIYPLSQAIEGAKTGDNPLLELENSPLTYHYYTGDITNLNDPYFAQNAFLAFNKILGQILRNNSRE